MITRTVVFTAFLTVWTAITALNAQPSVAPTASASGVERLPALPSVFDRMQRNEPLALTLRADFSQLLDNRYVEVVESGAITFSSTSNAPKSVTLPVEVSMRGKYRRRVCAFPPLKLKFEGDDLQKAGMAPKYRTLKLVTHCLEDVAVARQNVLREYLAYQLYGLLTENAFRTQLVQVTYIDDTGRQPDVQRLGFLIEDSDEMAHRLLGKECDECLNPPLSAVSAKEATLLSLFQYMIGNSDWNTLTLRNVKFVERAAEGQHLLVPYDFDFAGLVNAPYAVPNPDYPIRDVRDRVFIGYPVEDPILQWAINYTKFKKEAIVQYVDQFELLNRSDRRDIIAYLEQFFHHIEGLDVNRTRRIYQRLTAAPLYYTSAMESEGVRM